jgi:hypothetical protein
MRVAAPAGDYEISMGILCTPGKLSDKGRLATPRFAGDQYYTPLATQCKIKMPIQGRQLFLACHEGWPFRSSGLGLRQEGWLWGSGASEPRRGRELSI